MSNYIIRAKNHEEWLAARKGGIGASEIGTILGVNPYETPYQLWLEKTGRAPKKPENFLMRAGHYLEDAVAHFCADETGLEIIKQSAGEFVVVNSEKEYMRVSPDRYAWLPNAKHTKENKVIVECKTSQKYIDPDSVPMSYFLQCQYQMGVCEMDIAYLAWLIQGRDFGYKRLTFDADFFKDVIVAELDRFWTDNILGDQEPALINVSDVLLKFPRHSEGKFLEASPDIVEKYEILKGTNDEIKRLTTLKTDMEESIKFALKDAETLVLPASEGCEGKTLATWRAAKNTQKFDEKLFASENPELYSKYMMTTTGSRRFSLK